MPILEIEIVLQPGEILMSDLAARLADAAAEIFKSEPRGTRVRLRTLDAVQYAENASGAGSDVFPVFVSVLKARLETDILGTEADQLAESLAHICNRPKENVHIFYQPEARGRVAFGGKLLKP